ncbi:MAG: AAA family ATPase, partial [Micromonosporaceae bacterium]
MFLEPAPATTAYSRFEELSRFTDLLERAGRRPCVIDLAGDRWSGKTRMLGDFATIATNAGWKVLGGSAALPPAELFFGVFAHALDALIRDTNVTSRLPPADRQHLVRVFPALEGAAERPASVSSSESYHIFVAMRRLLETTDRKEGMLLLLDDMHLADDASVDLLRCLMSHDLDATLSLVIAHRPRQSGPALRILLREGAAQRQVHQIAVGPLSRQSALALLPDDLSDSQREVLVDHAAGNAGLLRAFGELRGLPLRGDGTPVGLPPWLLDRCAAEFHRLSPAGRRAVNAATVLDAPFTLEALRAVAQLDDAVLLDALDELTIADILEFVGNVRLLRFTSPALRAAAYLSARPGWLLGAHARVAEILDARSAPVERLARHLAKAPRIDPSRVAVLMDASRNRLWTDPAQAASWCAVAAELSGSLTALSPEQRLLYGKTLALAGPLNRALEVLDSVQRESSAPDRLTAEATRWRAWVWALLGDVEVGRKEVLSAMQSADAQTL